MRSLNVTAMTVYPDPIIANAGASVSVTGHGIIAFLPEFLILDPEHVCECPSAGDARPCA